jgi:hypothetical protein
MADKRISELVTIATVDLAMDLFPIVDSSAAETKKITPIALKTSLALNNVDNTSDLNKPISTLTQDALDNKQATLISGSNIKTINSTTILGGGDLQVAPASGIDATAIATGVVSNAEFETLNGVTSAIQVQLDAKQATITGGASTIASTDLTVSRALVSNAVGKVAVATTTSTELGYVNGVTSAIQTQLDAKQATLVSGTNIKTINSTSIVGSGDIVINASPSGVSGAIQFSNGSAFASDATNFFWDDANNRLGVGTNAPSATAHFKGSGSTSATTSLLVQNSAGTNLLNVRDDGTIVFETSIGFSNNSRNIFFNDSVAGVYGSGVGIQAFGGFGVRTFDGSAYSLAFVVTGNGNQRVGIGSTLPNASAKLDVTSTTQGFLPPRMTNAQRSAISSPAVGLMVYCTDAVEGLYINKSTGWTLVI